MDTNHERMDSVVPSGTFDLFMPRYPALKGWAIFKQPFLEPIPLVNDFHEADRFLKIAF
jgi:hypothetical protein